MNTLARASRNYDRPIPSSEKTVTAGVELRKNILAVESQGVRLQGELIGGKPPDEK
jgi:hypothetical protein